MKKDSELLTKFIKDDNLNAFEQIMLRYQKIVYNTCLQTLRDQTDAEDAAQATFLALIKKVKSLKNKDFLSTWLYKVAICVSKKMIRSNIRQREREVKYAMESKKSLETPRRISILHENRVLIQEAIASLPERYSMPLIAHYFEEKSYKEVAADLGLSATAISTRISRGIEKIRKKLIRKGIAGISTGVLIKYLGISSAEAVPAGLTASLCSLATTGTTSTVITTTATAALTSIQMAKIKMVIGTIVAATVIGAGGYKITDKIIKPQQVQLATTVEAVERALKWLSRHQEIDGKWNPEKYEGKKGGKDSDIGITAFVCLAFTRAGYSHLPDSKYGKTLRKALDKLISCQDKETGAISSGYVHAIATTALCEAYRLGKDKHIGETASKALDFCLYAQNEKEGGWRYQPKQSPDTSVTSWYVVALKTGLNAGVKTNPLEKDKIIRTMKKSLNWIDKCTDKKTGMVGYMGSKGTVRLTALGMVCKLFCGVSKKDQMLIKKQAELLLKHLPEWKKRDFYYWYYGTMAMHEMGGKYWTVWNKKMKTALITNQNIGGEKDGSWDIGPEDGAKTGGKIWSTAGGALCLEISYKFSRVDIRKE
jgi:RNA polymerase sigma factor (sigma-70 family)